MIGLLLVQSKSAHFEQQLREVRGIQAVTRVKRESPLGLSNNESYSVWLDQEGIYNIEAETQTGAFYAHVDLLTGKTGNFTQDPAVPHRGVMIDTGRHFLTKASIKKVLTGMGYAKLNVLHWRLSQKQAFTAAIPSLPELAASGAAASSSIYTEADIKEIVAFAQTKQIRVIPEFDSPCQARSWGLSAKYSGIVLPCGCLDPSNATTFDVLQKLYDFISNTFPDEYIHFGGDTNYGCWNSQQSIKDFMKANNLNSTSDLQKFYENKIKQQLPNKKFIFMSTGDNPTRSGTDVSMHEDSDASRFSGSTEKIIFSSKSTSWMNFGVQPGTGKILWRTIYNNFVLFPQAVDRSRVLGHQIFLWGEYINDEVLDNVLWPRGLALADLMWSESKKSMSDQAIYMYNVKEILNSEGIYAEPFAGEFCELFPKKCF